MMEKDYTKPSTMADAKAEWKQVFRLLARLDAVQIPAGDPGKRDPAALVHVAEVSALANWCSGWSEAHWCTWPRWAPWPTAQLSDHHRTMPPRLPCKKSVARARAAIAGKGCFQKHKNFHRRWIEKVRNL